jgi:hypothetical protein
VIKKVLVLTAAGALGNYLTERFILRMPGATGGFIDNSAGFGMDDVARGVVYATLSLIGLKIAGS